MADLRNAQRISYKATYNQVGASAVIGKGGEKEERDRKEQLMRAVEKAAFVQALRIIPQELTMLRPRVPGAAAKEALVAVEELVNDSRPAATLINASRFAAIDHTALVEVAEALIAHRESVADSIDESLAQILVAHRASTVASAASTSPATSAEAAPTEAPPAARTGTTPIGIPVLTTTHATTEREAPEAASQRISEGYSVKVSIDESKSPPPVLTPAMDESAPTTYTPSNAAALAWAERNQPELMTKLSTQLAPYTRLSESQQTSLGSANAFLDLLQNRSTSIFETSSVRGAIAGFQSRMTIEPVGNLHLERIEMYPAGVERGELAHSVPLAPGETVNTSHKEWSVSEKEFEDIVTDYFEGYSEEGVADKTDIAMSNDSQSQHSTALNLAASLSASYASVTLSTSAGYTAASNDSQSKKDSRNHSMAITKKASARSKKDHKMTFKVTSVAGSEDQSVRVISNPSATDSMRIDYFQLARRWKMDLLRYGLRMTYDIVIPNPGAGIAKLVEDAKALDELIDTPFTFNLPLSAITYNSLATNPNTISNYDQLAAQYDASVTAPPEARKFVNVHKESPELEYDHVNFDSIEFEVDESYYIYEYLLEVNYEHNQGDNRSYIHTLDNAPLTAGLNRLIGTSGKLSLDLELQYINKYAINITFSCRPKVQVLLDWRLGVWNQIRQAAEDTYTKSIQSYKDQQAKLLQEIADFDALTLRRMEQEEIMKGVLRWLLGPDFYLVPFDIASLFGPDTNDPGVQDVLDPNSLSELEWLDVMEHGELIKYLHNAIEWENVLYFTYPYFWDDNKLWEFKKFLYHPDATHRTFLRAGAARVVLTIRPGFEASFTSLIESGSFGALPGPHPYVTIAQEIQDYANTNYPGFPPANPEQNARPLLYLEQRRVWREMQYVIQLLNAYKADKGAFPAGTAGDAVPAAELDPYRDGPIVVNGVNYKGVNDYNTQSNDQQLIVDPETPQESLLPTYTAVPVNDIAWGNPYLYKCPGDTGDYDLICFGADGQPGGTDKDADISANAEASLISTWYEYTPINGLDIGITMNQPNVVPPQPSAEIG